jgi:hypothetical protein
MAVTGDEANLDALLCCMTFHAASVIAQHYLHD